LAFKMKICSTNLYYNVEAADKSPAEYLDRMPLLQRVPAALAAAGHDVDVVQLYTSDQTFVADGVLYHFIRPATLEKSVARVEATIDGRIWTRHVPAMRAVRRILDLQPDVVHFHRLGQSNSLYLLQMLRSPNGPAIVAQYHGGRLTGGWLERRIQRASLRQIQRALFARQEDADLFVADGVLREEQVIVVNDKTTDLTMTSRPQARLESRLEGTPIILWYSDLEPERDPMTAVLGFKLLLNAWPDAQLYMFYGGDEMLTQMRAYVIANPELAGHVHFQSQKLGPAREHVFNSADFLLQTDLDDAQEQALLDAMASGVIPVLSDIPLFRKMADNGRCGFLFPPGDGETMAKQLLKFGPGEIAGRAALVHDWFEAAYSYDAMAGLWLDIYTEAIGERMETMSSLGEAVTEGSG